MAKKFTPKDVIVLSKLEAVRVLSDPIRTRILECFDWDEPRSVKEIAAALSLPPTKLYYHVGLMEKHGILKVTKERVVSGIIEKLYQATAKFFLVDSDLFLSRQSSGSLKIGPLITDMFNKPRESLKKSIRDGLVEVDEEGLEIIGASLGWGHKQLSPKLYEDLLKRVKKLYADFVEGPEYHGNDGIPCELISAFFKRSDKLKKKATKKKTKKKTTAK